jgi:hypothetical protein
MAYAAPASGVLCHELLRPTFRGTHPQDKRISRSSLVQSLSLLVSCLDQIRANAPNGALCANCKRIIQYVLDYRLNALEESVPRMEDLDWTLPSQVEFDFDLLDTFDWLQQDVFADRE